MTAAGSALRKSRTTASMVRASSRHGISTAIRWPTAKARWTGSTPASAAGGHGRFVGEGLVIAGISIQDGGADCRSQARISGSLRLLLLPRRHARKTLIALT